MKKEKNMKKKKKMNKKEKKVLIRNTKSTGVKNNEDFLYL